MLTVPQGESAWLLANHERIGAAVWVWLAVRNHGPEIGMEKIARLARTDPRTAMRHVRHLEEVGILETQHARGKTNRYRVLWGDADEEEPKE